jgi:putative addiction module CopG family antidote
MEIRVPAQLEDFVYSQVRSGRYVDEDEVVRDALRQMRALQKAAEDPNVSGLVRDAMTLATQAQRDVLSLLQSADSETNLFQDVLGYAATMANSALDAVRKVPGARELDRVLRGPVAQVTAAAELGESQARLMRQNLEATAKALGMLTAVLERFNGATRAVNEVILPSR